MKKSRGKRAKPSTNAELKSDCALKRPKKTLFDNEAFPLEVDSVGQEQVAECNEALGATSGQSDQCPETSGYGKALSGLWMALPSETENGEFFGAPVSGCYG